jgi:hypothetical protein
LGLFNHGEGYIRGKGSPLENAASLAVKKAVYDVANAASRPAKADWHCYRFGSEDQGLDGG